MGFASPQDVDLVDGDGTLLLDGDGEQLQGSMGSVDAAHALTVSVAGGVVVGVVSSADTAHGVAVGVSLAVPAGVDTASVLSVAVSVSVVLVAASETDTANGLNVSTVSGTTAVVAAASATNIAGQIGVSVRVGLAGASGSDAAHTVGVGVVNGVLPAAAVEAAHGLVVSVVVWLTAATSVESAAIVAVDGGAKANHFPTFVLEVATTTDALNGSPTWQDISSHLEQFGINRGRAGEAGQARGEAEFTLDDPELDLIGGNLQPGRRMRLRVTAPTTATLFDGFIDDPQRIYDRRRGCTWRLRCYDLSALLAEDVATDLADGVGGGEWTGERIDRLLDLSGVPSSMRDIDTGRSRCAPHVATTGPLLAEIEKAVQTDAGRLFVSGDGKITFQQRYSDPDFYSVGIGENTSNSPAAHTVTSGVDRVFPRAQVTWSGGTVSDEDSSAVAQFGRRTRSLTTLLDNQRDAEALAEWTVLRLSTARDHLPSITIGPFTNVTNAQQLLGLDLFDRLGISRRANGAVLADSFDVLIEGISWRATDVELVLGLQLAPYVAADVWSWDDEWNNSDGLVWGY